MRKALEAAKASVKLIAPRLGGIRLSDGKEATIDGQLAGSPSAQFDAVASIIPLESGKKLAKQAAAQNWFRDAFGHLKAIAACKGTHAILDAAGVKPDAGIVDPSETKAFVKAAASRFWEREPTLRSLA
jgi:catalase